MLGWKWPSEVFKSPTKEQLKQSRMQLKRVIFMRIQPSGTLSTMKVLKPWLKLLQSHWWLNPGTGILFCICPMVGGVTSGTYGSQFLWICFISIIYQHFKLLAIAPGFYSCIAVGTFFLHAWKFKKKSFAFSSKTTFAWGMHKSSCSWSLDMKISKWCRVSCYSTSATWKFSCKWTGKEVYCSCLGSGL